MRFELHIGTDNAAFRDEGTEEFSPGPELARILRELAERIDGGLVAEQSIRLSDVNGNRVGFAVLTEPVKFQ